MAMDNITSYDYKHADQTIPNGSTRDKLKWLFNIK